MIIYLTTNLINGLIYIGQDTKNNLSYLGSGVKLLEAIKEFGRENFKKETLCHCKSRETLDKMEIYFIEKFDARNSEIGYNVALGGHYMDLTDEVRKKISESQKGKKLSEETKRKMGESHRGEKHHYYGKHLSRKTRRKISEANTGKKLTKEQRRKISESQTGEKHHYYGKHLPKEIRKKISESNKGKQAGDKNSMRRIEVAEKLKGRGNGMYGKSFWRGKTRPEHSKRMKGNNVEPRKIIMLNPETLEPIKNFVGLEKARIFVGLRQGSGICSCCKNPDMTAGGYRWRSEEWPKSFVKAWMRMNAMKGAVGFIKSLEEKRKAA